MEQRDVCCEEDHEVFEMSCLSEKQRRRGWLLERSECSSGCMLFHRGSDKHHQVNEIIIQCKSFT